MTSRFLQAFKTDFAKNVMVLSSGVTMAQLASFLLTPVVARLYAPEAFGLMAFFLSIATPLTNISSLKYDQAVLIADSDTAAGRLSSLACWINFIFCALCLAVLGAYKLLGNRLLSDLGYWIYLVPIFILISGQIRINNSECVSRQRFKTISSANIVGGLATPLLRIAYALSLSAVLSGLILAQLVSDAAKVLILIGGRSGQRLPRRTIRELVETARAYLDFPRYALPTGLLFSLGNQAPVLMLGMLFEPALVGYYALANRLIRMPVDLISQPIRQVFIQKVTEKVKHGDSILRLFILLGIAMGLSLLPFLILVELFGEQLFALMLGAEWTQAGNIAGIIFPWVFMSFIINPLSSLYIVFRKQAHWLRFQVALNVLLLAVFFGSHFMALEAAILLWIVTAINVLIYGLVIVHLVSLTVQYEKANRQPIRDDRISNG